VYLQDDSDEVDEDDSEEEELLPVERKSRALDKARRREQELADEELRDMAAGRGRGGVSSEDEDEDEEEDSDEDEEEGSEEEDEEEGEEMEMNLEGPGFRLPEVRARRALHCSFFSFFPFLFNLYSISILFVFLLKCISAYRLLSYLPLFWVYISLLAALTAAFGNKRVKIPTSICPDRSLSFRVSHCVRAY
jgi:hypothetical protein